MHVVKPVPLVRLGSEKMADAEFACGAAFRAVRQTSFTSRSPTSSEHEPDHNDHPSEDDNADGDDVTEDTSGDYNNQATLAISSEPTHADASSQPIDNISAMSERASSFDMTIVGGQCRATNECAKKALRRVKELRKLEHEKKMQEEREREEKLATAKIMQEKNIKRRSRRRAEIYALNAILRRVQQAKIAEYVAKNGKCKEDSSSSIGV